MTLRWYADVKGLKLDQVKITINHRRDYKKDCMDCTEKEARLDYIERRIELQGDLTNEQKNKLIEIAKKCPVHQTLQSQIAVETVLVL